MNWAGFRIPYSVSLFPGYTYDAISAPRSSQRISGPITTIFPPISRANNSDRYCADTHGRGAFSARLSRLPAGRPAASRTRRAGYPPRPVAPAGRAAYLALRLALRLATTEALPGQPAR